MREKKRHLVIHVDVDSPVKLMEFYQLKGITFDQNDMDEFYITSWERALDFFEKHSIKATFFVVGNELKESEVVQKVVLKAHNAGHEIENHTYSHPFGLATLDKAEIVDEIEKCSAIIEQVTGRKPIGFRSPGYSINSEIINLLEEKGFKYDTSGFWSIMNPILKNTHKLLFKNGLKNEGFGYVTRKLGNKPYIPDIENWLLKSKKQREIWELPLPRTSLLALPFYNNFNLWTPFFYSNLTSELIRKPYIVYLFHIIEFMDMNDNIPAELSVHPSLKTDKTIKMKKSDEIIFNLKKRYELISTENLIKKMEKEKFS